MGDLTIDAEGRLSRGELTVLRDAGRGDLSIGLFAVLGGARVLSERAIRVEALDPATPERWTLKGVLRGPRLTVPAVAFLDVDGGELDVVELVSQGAGIGTLTVKNSGVLRLSTPLAAGSITLTGSSRITLREPTITQTPAVDLRLTGTLTIELGSLVDAAAKGYLGGRRGDNTAPTGRTADNIGSSASGGTGGSHGAVGGFQGSGAGLGVLVSPVYDDFTHPRRPGGGGSARTTVSTERAYSGGGLVLILAQELALEGNIDAQGDGTQRGGNTDVGGGGGGGGVYISVQTIRGAGEINADGGSADGGVGAGAGGGGRIAIHYTNRASFTGRVHAYGGTLAPFVVKATSVGGAGTVFWKGAHQGYGDLVVDNNARAQSTTRTQLRPVGTGTITSLTPTVLGATASTFPTSDTGLQGQWVVVNGMTLTPFGIAGNDAKSLGVLPSSGDLTAVGAVGNPFQGAIVLDNLTVTNRGSMTTQGDLIIITTGSSSVINSSTLISPPVIHW